VIARCDGNAVFAQHLKPLANGAHHEPQRLIVSGQLLRTASRLKERAYGGENLRYMGLQPGVDVRTHRHGKPSRLERGRDRNNAGRLAAVELADRRWLFARRRDDVANGVTLGHGRGARKSKEHAVVTERIDHGGWSGGVVSEEHHAWRAVVRGKRG